MVCPSVTEEKCCCLDFFKDAQRLFLCCRTEQTTCSSRFMSRRAWRAEPTTPSPQPASTSPAGRRACRGRLKVRAAAHTEMHYCWWAAVLTCWVSTDFLLWLITNQHFIKWLFKTNNGNSLFVYFYCSGVWAHLQWLDWACLPRCCPWVFTMAATHSKWSPCWYLLHWGAKWAH